MPRSRCGNGGGTGSGCCRRSTADRGHLSGHGLQPIWALDKISAAALEYPGEAKRLLVRWGNLVKLVSADLGYKTDGVFDLARVLRVPGSVNSKDPDHPVTVVCEQICDTVLTVEGLRTTLDALNIPEVLTKAKTKGGPASNGHRRASPDEGVRETYSLNALVARVQKASYGNRNRTLFGAAKDAARQGDLGEGVYEKLAEAAQRMDDPLAEDEIATTINQGRAAGEAEHDEDGEPLPLAHHAIEVPPFPVDALPDWMADMVTGVAEGTQTDPAMAATCGLSALSACTGGHIRVLVRPEWYEPPNLYTATVAAPGERKSAVQQLMVSPVYDAERELREAHRAQRLDAETTKAALVKWAEKKRNAVASAHNAEQRETAMEEALNAAREAEEFVVPVEPRLVADDITPESTASLLAEQDGRLAIMSAEGGILDIIWGRYSSTPNMDVWLKGHSGDPIRVDRKGRPAEHIPHPALTMGLMIQPALLATIAATRHEFRGRGLLARFLDARPVSKVGHRLIGAQPLNEETRKVYAERLSALASSLAGWMGDPAILTLTPEAHEAVLALERAIEPTLGTEGSMSEVTDWGAKYVGAVIRIAANLHMGLHGGDGFRADITAETIQAAGRIGDYFRACAINTFAEMSQDSVTAAAIYLRDRLLSQPVDELSERDIHILVRRRFLTKAELMPVIGRLIDTGWLIKLPPPDPTGGRPASPRYCVYRLCTKATQDTKGSRR